MNGNSIPCAFWMVAEVLQDPALLSRVRTTVNSYREHSVERKLAFNYAKLFSDPLLQSIYAETLRLHVGVFIMRSPAFADLDLGGWRIPKDAVMAVSSYDAQMDPKTWCSKDPFARPVDQFWAERFLAPLEPMAARTALSSRSTQLPMENDTYPISEATAKCSHPSASQYSLKARSANWIPYGGGQRICPGRHFAKQEMISTLAEMVTMFDIELAESTHKVPKNDLRHFGFGAMWPKGKMPVRMRRRDLTDHVAFPH